MALSTLEVRWFFEGPVEETGPGVEAWFRTRPRYGGSGRPRPTAWDPGPPAWRQDRYLLVPGHDDMGIKWREGRLEIKGRDAALGHGVFAPGIEGACERWIKWSHAGTRIEQRFVGLFRSDDASGGRDGIILVEKRRLQRYLRLDGVAGPVEASRGEPRGRGLNFELVRIRIPGSRTPSHWSLAFEAFPGDQQMSEQFAPVVARFLEGCPALPLSAQRSMAYPRWLLDFDRPAPT